MGLALTLVGKFPGHELNRLMENSSNQNSWLPIQFCTNSGHELDRFLENSSNFRILGMKLASFCVTGEQCHTLENWMKIRENFLDEFSRICQ